MKKNIKNHAPSLWLLIVLVGFPQISETIFTPSLPEIAASYQTTMSTTQLTMSIYFFAFAFGVFFWGWLSDIVGRRPAMLFGIAVYGLGSLLCFISRDMSFLLVARFVQAFGASTGSVTTQTILRESYHGKERHSLFAQISAALAFTPALGPLIGGFVGEYFGFRLVFFILVAMSVFVFGYAYFCLPETYDISQRQTIKLLPILKRLVTNPKVLTYGFLIGAINGILFSYYAEAPFIFTEYFGMKLSTYGFLGIVIALASIVGSLLSKKLLPKMAAEKIIILGLVIMLGGILLILGISLIPIKIVGLKMVGILVGVFITLLGTGTALPNCLSLALVDFQDVIGSASALFSLGYYFLVSFITFGMSYFHNGTLVAMPVYFLAIGITMLGLASKYVK